MWFRSWWRFLGATLGEMIKNNLAARQYFSRGGEILIITSKDKGNTQLLLKMAQT